MQGLAAVGAEPGMGAAEKADPRLKPTAHEFEACLMKEFLEPLQHDALFDDSDAAGSGNALMSFGAQALARAISDRGGFGIAAKIIGQLEKKGQTGAPARSDGEEFLRMGGKK